MARVRMTMEQVAASDEIDRVRVAATTDEDVRRYMIEDGENPDEAPAEVRTVLPLAALRSRVGMSQDKFAKALGIPAATLRNWEQGRTKPDPIAVSFFALVADDPERAFKVLAG